MESNIQKEKIQILIFDDDRADIKILRSFLKTSQIKSEIIEATSDQEIFRILNDNSLHPDIIFLDYQIPGMGGMQWLKEINDKKVAPVIVITGRGDEITAAESIKNGAFDYIPKDKLNNYELTKTILNCRERWEIQNERDALLGIAAHELRNPLTSILGYIEILSNYENLSQDKQKKIFTVLNERASYLQEIINSILDYARIDKGKIEINLTKNDLLKLIDELINKSRFLAENKKIRLVFSTSLNECFCNFDKVRIEEVITNLIDNAVKYSPQNSEVIINLEKTNNSAIIKVEDKGQGIKEDELKFLFELFSNVKLSSRPTAGEKSTGLGLAICKKIVSLHKGTIKVKSKLGIGSAFIVEIPLINS